MKKYLAIFLLISSSTFADYELIKGKGVDVCDAYLKNLSSFNGTIWVRRPINPEFKDFSKPEWGKTIWSGAIDHSVPDPDDLFQKINDFLFKRDANPAYYVSLEDQLAWSGAKQQIEKAHEGFIDYREQSHVAGNSIGRVDIDNDGKQELVYYDNNSGGQLLMVLKDDGTDIDYAKTRFVMQHKSRAEDRLGVFRPLHDNEKLLGDFEKYTHKKLDENAIYDASYDVFFYKGKTYFDLMGYKKPGFERDYYGDKGPLRVYIIENKQAQEVCTYRVFFGKN